MHCAANDFIAPAVDGATQQVTACVQNGASGPARATRTVQPPVSPVRVMTGRRAETERRSPSHADARNERARHVLRQLGRILFRQPYCRAKAESTGQPPIATTGGGLRRAKQAKFRSPAKPALRKSGEPAGVDGGSGHVASGPGQGLTLARRRFSPVIVLKNF